MEYSYFPVRLKSLGARLCFHELEEGAFDLGKVHIAVHYLNHTSLTLGYRLTCGGKSLAYCTDVEPGALTLWREDLIGPKGVPPKESLIKGIVHLEDRRLVEFCRGVDVLILDSQYTDEEYRIKKKTGWGHSTGQFAARVAIASGARHLFFFHHDPNHADSQIDENIAAGRKLAQGFAIGIEGAREGEEVAL
jgi:phosphoribosyl 1,2-cyclic phosphodiesterase